MHASLLSPSAERLKGREHERRFEVWLDHTPGYCKRRDKVAVIREYEEARIYLIVLGDFGKALGTSLSCVRALRMEASCTSALIF
jgi:hypothetical protein